MSTSCSARPADVGHSRHCEERKRRPAVARYASYGGLGVRRSALARRRKQSILPLWPHGLLRGACHLCASAIALVGGAHSRDPLARNDGWVVKLAPTHHER